MNYEIMETDKIQHLKNKIDKQTHTDNIPILKFERSVHVLHIIAMIENLQKTC